MKILPRVFGTFVGTKVQKGFLGRKEEEKDCKASQ